MAQYECMHVFTSICSALRDFHSHDLSTLNVVNHYGTFQSFFVLFSLVLKVCWDTTYKASNM